MFTVLIALSCFLSPLSFAQEAGFKQEIPKVDGLFEDYQQGYFDLVVSLKRVGIDEGSTRAMDWFLRTSPSDKEVERLNKAIRSARTSKSNILLKKARKKTLLLAESIAERIGSESLSDEGRKMLGEAIFAIDSQHPIANKVLGRVCGEDGVWRSTMEIEAAENRRRFEKLAKEARRLEIPIEVGEPVDPLNQAGGKQCM